MDSLWDEPDSRRNAPASKEILQSRAVGELIRAGAERYDRERHLTWLARATAEEIGSRDPEVGRRIVTRLSKALRSERQRGWTGHWSYDLSRHIALAQALNAERRRLEVILDGSNKAGYARHPQTAGEEHN